jgi:excisionase family DNA binding protein
MVRNDRLEAEPEGHAADRDQPVVSSGEVRWLSTREAAHHLGITTRTLYRLIDSGQIPAYRFGRVIRLKTAEVDAFVESARIRPGSLEHLYADAGPSELEA